MKTPSALTHLYRLGALFIVFIIVFLAIRQIATPSSWNYEVWYRGAALTEDANKPLLHGGNDSCNSCHEEVVKVAKKLKHKTLSCEGCHGPLGNHVRNDEKIADAEVINQSRWQCLNCHDELISKPKRFPQFTDAVEKHTTLVDGEVCLKCHDAHDPTP
jgi:hypothetical protein